jgi:hypothetical protein
LFFTPPVLEKHYFTAGGDRGYWVSKGALEHTIFEGSFRERRVDVSRLIITLLAINFLPAVVLWQYDQVREWLRRHKKKTVVFGYVLACVIGVLFILVVGSAIYEQQTRRADRTPSFPIGINLVSPSPAPAASPSKPMTAEELLDAASPTSADSVASPSPGFVDATPTPVRRAIPVTH